ncbi:MAG: Rne/Rng family ribonuclease, partial [Candidatus Omnitrophica bacterium]|nr:Rne/Rng family ribonuclease [Candidatus Omnitrophota bacterium]
VIPGLEAAFVDIGIGRNAFLHVHDFAPKPNHAWDLENSSGEEEDLDGETEVLEPSARRPTRPAPEPIRIRDYLNEGQSILVQMEKEPLGQKGCRVTAHISLPGRFLVFFPTSNHVAISRRIADPAERERLAEIGRRLAGEQYGVILRTAAEAAPEEDLAREFDLLRRRWEGVVADSEKASAPSLVYEEEGLLYQVVRDFCVAGTEEILVEGADIHKRVKGYISQILPSLAPRVHLYLELIPLFRARGIDAEIERLLQRRVWLKSGGYLVIDEAEALTVIDVNTGRDLGRGSLEETAFATNLEATAEIARQLRLRDIGGILVVDFIDMLSPLNQKALLDQFRSALARDRSHPTLFSMTELGLVQLTRKRVRKSVPKSLSRLCPYCKGEGIILSEETMVTRIMRRLEELILEDPRDNITLHVHPALAEEINSNRSDRLEALARKLDARVRVVAKPGLHLNDIEESFEEE